MEQQPPKPQTPQPTASPDKPASASKPIPPPAKPAKTSGVNPFLWIGVGVLAVLIFTGGYFVSKLTDSNTPSSSPVSSTQDGNAAITSEEKTISTIAEKVSPSVVSIVTEVRRQSYFGTTSGQGAGTGIIVSENGYVMTNNHVIEGAANVSIVDNNGDLYENVTVIGRDPLNDVAFLKIKSDEKFTPATLGNSSTLRTGQQVIAIGNALGQFSNTVTSGIISGVGRPVTANSGNGQSESLTDLIQTDASINPGNSGGPLLNMAGQVIGINTAIVEDANGIGFAIPVNSTKGILAEVLATGKANRAFLGVNFLAITPEIAREYKLPSRQGAYVFASGGVNPVASGSPAEKAGFKKGDIITKIDNSIVGSQQGLSSVIGQYRPGDTATATFLRDGKERTTQITFSTYSN